MEENNLLSLEQTKEFDQEIVQKHFNEIDRKLLKLILSQVKGGEEVYLFDFKELESLGFDLVQNQQEVFHSLEKIASYYVNIQNGDGDFYHMGLINNKFSIDQETRILSLKIHKELVPFLTHLRQQYSYKKIT